MLTQYLASVPVAVNNDQRAFRIKKLRLSQWTCKQRWLQIKTFSFYFLTIETSL